MTIIMMSTRIQTATHANANHDQDEDSDGGGHRRVMEQNTNCASNDIWEGR